MKERIFQASSKLSSGQKKFHFAQVISIVIGTPAGQVLPSLGVHTFCFIEREHEKKRNFFDHLPTQMLETLTWMLDEHWKKAEGNLDRLLKTLVTDLT